MKVHIIVPVHNRAAVSERFAAALARQTLRDFRLVLVDDGCTDDTVARVRQQLGDGQLLVLRGDGNLWWAGALQLAYEHVLAEPVDDGHAVLILNDDVEFADDFLQQGLSALALHRDACIQAIGVDRSSGSVDRGAIADLRRLDFRPAVEDEAPNCLSTRGLLMSAKTFKHSGGLRPRWLPHYLSDYEFTLRLQRGGTRLVVDDSFRAVVDSELTGLDAPSATSLRALWSQTLSNRVKFNPKHWSAFVVMACPATSIPRHLAAIWFRFARSLTRAAWPRTGTAR